MKSNCDTCLYFSYDEVYDEYYCQVNLDEDEMERFLRDENSECPYYRLENEYKTVQKQI